jgi:hypothetical protein
MEDYQQDLLPVLSVTGGRFPRGQKAFLRVKVHQREGVDKI